MRGSNGDRTPPPAKSPITTRVNLKGSVDETARSVLGIGLKDYLKGPIAISGTLTGRRGSQAKANAWAFTDLYEKVLVYICGDNSGFGIYHLFNVNTCPARQPF